MGAASAAAPARALGVPARARGPRGRHHDRVRSGKPAAGPGRVRREVGRAGTELSPAGLAAGAARAGSFDEVGMRVLGRPIAVRVWSPAGGPLPLLVAHDGPEYDALSRLTRYAAAMIERGALPPFRVALLPPGDRNEWYSASAVYGRALCRRILPAMPAASRLPVGPWAWARAWAGSRCSRPSGLGPDVRGPVPPVRELLRPALRPPRVLVPALRSHRHLRRRRDLDAPPPAIRCE